MATQKGVYILFAKNEDGKLAVIKRVANDDKAGILYIGQTTKQNFNTRLKMMRRVMNIELKATAHSGAKKYKEIEAIRNLFPINGLYVKLEVSSKPKKREHDLLDKYRQKFGEVPPLNSTS